MLNSKQSIAMQSILSGDNVYIGGAGGVGKSYLIHHIMEKLASSTVLMAPTGIAALNIGGSTINSQLKIPLCVLTDRNTTPRNSVIDLFGGDSPVKRIIVDEVSMVRGDKLWCMDWVLRKARRNSKPFGGLQVIVVGDFYQLPPVLSNKEKNAYLESYDGVWAFQNTTWSECGFKYIELDEIVRQTDSEMINNLMAIRSKSSNYNGISYRNAIDYFNHHGLENAKRLVHDDPTFLCSVNASADTLNATNYDQLDDKERVYYGTFGGEYDRNSLLPAPNELCLKVGAKVIITANTPDYKNGQTGYVAEMTSDVILVLLEDGERLVTVNRNRWNEIDYKNQGGALVPEEIGFYEQFPLKLGWAVTIHKAQGLTLSKAIIDFGRGCFVSGQSYVALSRLRSIDGLGLLSRMGTGDVIVDRDVSEFYRNGCRGMGL